MERSNGNEVTVMYILRQGQNMRGTKPFMGRFCNFPKLNDLNKNINPKQ